MLTRESPLAFGRSHRLFGLLTEPVDGASGPTVIMLNAGLIHRIGPRRIHVHLARRLAASGLRVLRVDLSGIGDSEARKDGLSAVDGLQDDVRQAMDALAQRTGARASSSSSASAPAPRSASRSRSAIRGSSARC